MTSTRKEASFAVAISDHHGDDRQLSFSAGDVITLKVLKYYGLLDSTFALCRISIQSFRLFYTYRISMQTRNSDKWFTGKVHNKYGLLPADKVNVVLKSEIPIKNPSINYKYLKDSLSLVHLFAAKLLKYLANILTITGTVCF